MDKPSSKVPRKTAPPKPIHNVLGTIPEKSAPGPSLARICRNVGKIFLFTPGPNVTGADDDDAEEGTTGGLPSR